jgi:hypothetical protein|uniref:Uncharacterized protein n=1 Tax=Eutreptiella gymnastica TaxID=73025 RepID=A0A7S4FRE0_9EUGL|mmetsp:Transcript_55430/g.92198  ORF Transcript_55430/g.92198 Transcript_55430/m.92198 type:complete len:124 (+) Transcript_55430:33-404(+)|eukprot:CAMPEP_0174281012 /NCGR_PEP_ID=MMETSP0809-20121228/1343_1 /TAXON_ID=73025 ORGANISM="Eutreptiella gymnastica-like, Strain CCMP1594" /NCGR_SAMPLE_ID=MMETSP0809 /ASSEMBLY_ACC=CAM_ASM_000658 /LENGTH=123 /DNA_ID=CAMNT_0015374271 /DNA_START=35 /DNA_END=406 /DNA_ORIENTATION=+
MDSYTKRDESVWWVSHPIAQKTAMFDIPQTSLKVSSLCEEYVERYRVCARESVDPALQCKVWQEDLQECKRGTKQKQYLEQYENATNSFTLAEKNDFRNKWHENFFRGGLTDTVREIQKTDKP